jgi:hypothetical protein
LPIQKDECEGLSPLKAGSKREASSNIIKAVSYVFSQSTIAPGFIADPTSDSVFACYGSIVGEKHV